MARFPLNAGGGPSFSEPTQVTVTATGGVTLAQLTAAVAVETARATAIETNLQAQITALGALINLAPGPVTPPVIS